MAIKQLAGQTIWYGLSNVISRLLNSLLTPILTYFMGTASGLTDFGEFSVLYAWVALFNIIYTYGLETGYFRFSNEDKFNTQKLFNSTYASHIVTTLLFSAVLIYFSEDVAHFISIGEHPEIVTATVLVLAFDTLSAIPFAKLRQENRPQKYAFIKVAGIAMNIVFVVFFIALMPKYFSNSSNAVIQWLFEQNRVFLLVLANLIQAFVTFLLLYKEWGTFRLEFDSVLWKKVMIYSTPMIIIGLAGMVNEVIDRQMLKDYLPYTIDINKQYVAIYSANYKIAIFITLFIQAFRMAAEPFFFKQKNEQNAPQVYANVMKWFVIVLCIAFLFTSLYLEIIKYMLGSSYRSGLYIVPILLMANVFLGIYYNLSVWYKITDKMYWGIIITVIGAVITLLGNYYFIPQYELLASATVTMICYGTMVVLAYIIGQKYYPIPYNVRRIIQYLSLMLILYFVHNIIKRDIIPISTNTGLVIYDLVAGTIFMLFFIRVVSCWEQINIRQSLKQLPMVGKYF